MASGENSSLYRHSKTWQVKSEGEISDVNAGQRIGRDALEGFSALVIARVEESDYCGMGPLSGFNEGFMLTWTVQDFQEGLSIERR